MKISKQQIVDLSCLEGLAFSKLELVAPGFSNIQIINGNKGLKTLSISGNRLKSYLTGLYSLNNAKTGEALALVEGPRVGPIAGYLTDTIDLSPLADLPALEKLILGPGIRNIEFVRKLPSIEELKTEDTLSLKGIEALPNLKELEIGECSELDSLQPLMGLKLAKLRFSGTIFNKRLWEEFMDYLSVANNVAIDFERYSNIPKKRIQAIAKMKGVTEFDFTEDTHFGNSFSFIIRKPRMKRVK